MLEQVQGKSFHIRKKNTKFCKNAEWILDITEPMLKQHDLSILPYPMALSWGADITLTVLFMRCQTPGHIYQKRNAFPRFNTCKSNISLVI